MLRYRFLSSLFACGVVLRALLRGDWADLRARLGFGAPPLPGPHIWLHAASNGELTSAQPVIDLLRDQRPDLGLLVTCNSASGVALARSWGIAAQLAPVDLFWTTRAVIRRWQVQGLIVMESELWPNRLMLCPGPVVVLGARLSKTSAQRARWFGGLAARLMARLSLVVPQDAASADRFLALGLGQDRLGPVLNLKALYAPDQRAPDTDLMARFARNRTWLAASTHPGEEEIVLAAHALARQAHPDLSLILAPRHPKRGTTVAALARANGLTAAQRSLGQAPDADVYVVDTLGEMDLWYQLSGRVFIGGSLVDKGGHTPFEPGAWACALLYGPFVGNFDESYTRLNRAQAALRVPDAAGLALALGSLNDPHLQAESGQAARACLSENSGWDGIRATITHLLSD